MANWSPHLHSPAHLAETPLCWSSALSLPLALEQDRPHHLFHWQRVRALPTVRYSAALSSSFYRILNVSVKQNAIAGGRGLYATQLQSCRSSCSTWLQKQEILGRSLPFQFHVSTTTSRQILGPASLVWEKASEIAQRKDRGASAWFFRQKGVPRFISKK